MLLKVGNLEQLEQHVRAIVRVAEIERFDHARMIERRADLEFVLQLGDVGATVLRPWWQPFHGIRRILGDGPHGPNLVDRARTNQMKHAVVADDLLGCGHGEWELGAGGAGGKSLCAW